jgi:hypothetical protein
MPGSICRASVTALGKFCGGGVVARAALGGVCVLSVVRRAAYVPVRGVEKRTREERSYWGKKSRARSGRRDVNGGWCDSRQSLMGRARKTNRLFRRQGVRAQFRRCGLYCQSTRLLPLEQPKLLLVLCLFQSDGIQGRNWRNSLRKLIQR